MKNLQENQKPRQHFQKQNLSRYIWKNKKKKSRKKKTKEKENKQRSLESRLRFQSECFPILLFFLTADSSSSGCFMKYTKLLPPIHPKSLSETIYCLFDEAFLFSVVVDDIKKV